MIPERNPVLKTGRWPPMDHAARELRARQPLHHGQVLHVLVHAEGALAEVEHGDDAARTPEVRGLVPGQAENHLRPAELARADAAAVPLVGEAGPAEVHDDDLAAARPPRLGGPDARVRRQVDSAVSQHDVAALEVRVRHADAVEEGETLEQLPGHLPRVGHVEASSAVGLQEVPDVRLQRLEDEAEVVAAVQEGVQHLHAEALPLGVARLDAQSPYEDNCVLSYT